MDATNMIFYIAILVMSIVIHEVAHGFMAEYFGDKTARFAGRLTLNPIKHLLGWAKPVPYNPDNLSNRKWGTMWVAVAGVLANFSLALIFGIIIRFTYDMALPSGFYFITSVIVVINLALGIFNLIPIPPLDGSKILFSLLPESATNFINTYEQYSLVILLVFIVFFSNSLSPILGSLFKLFTGLSF